MGTRAGRIAPRVDICEEDIPQRSAWPPFDPKATESYEEDAFGFFAVPHKYVDTGVPIDGTLSVELMLNVFFPNSPLHDGAVIVQGERLGAAGCVLPLAEVHASPIHYGTRHRAAIGISEVSDSLAVVVSEETGRISIANNGHLVSNLDEEKLRKVLGILYRPPGGDQLPWQRGRNGPSSNGPSSNGPKVDGPQGRGGPPVDDPRVKV